MRKALFAVILVSASFAGGAFVNGPGLQWAQQQLMSRLGIEEEAADGETVDASNVLPRVDGASDDPPERPIPPLASEPTEVASASGKDAAKDKARNPSESRLRSTASRSKANPASELPGLAPVPEGASPPLESPAPTTNPREREREALTQALADAEAAGREAVKDARGQARTVLATASDDAATFRAALDRAPAPLPPPEPLPSPEPGPTPASEPAAPTTPADSPAAAAATAVPEPEPEPAASKEAPAASAATSAGGGEWSEIRRTMKSLGVSRYGIEGEPGGRVRFYCVIPLAGRRAVGQHFEAEGDDEIQAAQAALRRVSLWRATEENGRNP